MNIGIFTDTYYPNVNGVVRSIETLKDNLEQAGHNVYIITTVKVNYEEKNILRIGNFPIEILKGYKVALPYSYRLFKKIKRLKLDVIHTHTEWSVGIFGRIVARRLGIPYVHTFHTMYENYLHYMAKYKGERISRKLMKQIIRNHCNHTEGVIAPSLKAEQTLLRYRVKKQIEIIPTGIELEKFRVNISPEKINKEKEKLKIKENDFIGLYVGRLAKEKNIEPIINSIKDIKFDNYKLLIVGGGPEEENLKKMVNEIGIGNKVIFIGEKPMEEVPLYYNIADLFIQSSKTETQGLTIFETMAAGTALLVRYDTNISNFFSNEEECIYYNEDFEIAEKINILIENPQMIQKIKNNASQKINNFSAEKFAKKVERVYKKAIKRKESKKRFKKLRKLRYMIKLK